ncbi:diaminopimelate epimerase [Bacilliculturomica massiliensis]|uniref:diaminopimelate epimerase n=1 Tax=Bacilliculturomica massiliensis TaxID=1917867 RepID=UPI0010321A45|nr:diaminopimelate epimerase [Bacilliculturomica massiliensis]
MKFSKFQGAGNDFIILNNMEEKIPAEKLGAVARQLCRRRFSLGADGLMAVDHPVQGGDYRMRFYNADGSESEMCGNGARCIARYGYEKGLAGEIQRIETKAGMVTGRRIDPRMYQIRLNDPTKIELDHVAEIDGRKYEYYYVELGDPGIPHAIVELPEFQLMEEERLRELGRALRYYKDFPKGANVNFFVQTGPEELWEKTFERGVEDFTLACGTGTGSVVTVLTLLGRVSGRDVRVRVPGGELRITVELDGEKPDGAPDRVRALYLTGPTNIVAEGEITDEDFSLQ